MKTIKLPRMDSEQVADEIGKFIVDRISTDGLTGGVIGLSGGVDSTTVAALAKRAFDKYNDLNSDSRLELVGLVLPSGVNRAEDKEDGVNVAERLGIRYGVVNIEEIVQAHDKVWNRTLSVYDRGNLMSRVRANVLSTKSAIENKLVIGTGNKDEDFGIGYYTLFGDGAVHISPIGGLSKRLVKQMARYLGFTDIADREPTAGLEPGQTDFGDLGYSYETVELLLEGLEQGVLERELLEHPQIVAQINSELQRSKLSSLDEVVNDFLWRHNGPAKFKAELIHPPVAPITLIYEEEERK